MTIFSLSFPKEYAQASIVIHKGSIQKNATDIPVVPFINNKTDNMEWINNNNHGFGWNLIINSYPNSQLIQINLR